MSAPAEGPPVAFVDLQAQRRRLGPAIDEAIDRVLEHGRFIMGPEVTELEARLAERSGVSDVVGCSSGTDALLMALLALEVGPGDAVVVPAFTFPATPEVVALLGATPVFVDVDERTANLDADQIGGATNLARQVGLRPVAVLAVDLYGLPADHDEIAAAAQAAGDGDRPLAVVADAAQSLGAVYRDRPVGSLGAMAATSFFPAKPLGCYGDGGAVLTGDAELADRLRSVRVHGQGENKYDNVRVGINGRLDTIQAAILLAKLEVFDDELAARRRVADGYRTLLADRVGERVVAPPGPADRTSAWAQFTIQVDGRDAVAAHMADQGIPTAVYYPRPLHRQPAYRDAPTFPGTLERSDRLAGRVLSLPMHPYLDEATQERVVDALGAAVDATA